jgi:hypothetical protein
MFIAPGAHAKDLAPLGAKPESGTVGEQAKAIALLRSVRERKDGGAINISPLRGEETNNGLLHFQLGFMNLNEL